MQSKKSLVWLFLALLMLSLAYADSGGRDPDCLDDNKKCTLECDEYSSDDFQALTALGCRITWEILDPNSIPANVLAANQQHLTANQFALLDEEHLQNIDWQSVTPAQKLGLTGEQLAMKLTEDGITYLEIAAKAGYLSDLNPEAVNQAFKLILAEAIGPHAMDIDFNFAAGKVEYFEGRTGSFMLTNYGPDGDTQVLNLSSLPEGITSIESLDDGSFRFNGATVNTGGSLKVLSANDDGTVTIATDFGTWALGATQSLTREYDVIIARNAEHEIQLDYYEAMHDSSIKLVDLEDGNLQLIASIARPEGDEDFQMKHAVHIRIPGEGGTYYSQPIWGESIKIQTGKTRTFYDTEISASERDALIVLVDDPHGWNVDGVTKGKGHAKVILSGLRDAEYALVPLQDRLAFNVRVENLNGKPLSYDPKMTLIGSELTEHTDWEEVELLPNTEGQALHEWYVGAATTETNVKHIVELIQYGYINREQISVDEGTRPAWYFGSPHGRLQVVHGMDPSEIKKIRGYSDSYEFIFNPDQAFYEAIEGEHPRAPWLFRPGAPGVTMIGPAANQDLAPDSVYVKDSPFEHFGQLLYGGPDGGFRYVTFKEHILPGVEVKIFQLTQEDAMAVSARTFDYSKPAFMKVTHDEVKIGADINALASIQDPGEQSYEISTSVWGSNIAVALTPDGIKFSRLNEGPILTYLMEAQKSGTEVNGYTWDPEAEVWADPAGHRVSSNEMVEQVWGDPGLKQQAFDHFVEHYLDGITEVRTFDQGVFKRDANGRWHHTASGTTQGEPVSEETVKAALLVDYGKRLSEVSGTRELPEELYAELQNAQFKIPNPYNRVELLDAQIVDGEIVVQGVLPPENEDDDTSMALPLTDLAKLRDNMEQAQRFRVIRPEEVRVQKLRMLEPGFYNDEGLVLIVEEGDERSYTVRLDKYSISGITSEQDLVYKIEQITREQFEIPGRWLGEDEPEPVPAIPEGVPTDLDDLAPEPTYEFPTGVPDDLTDYPDEGCNGVAFRARGGYDWCCAGFNKWICVGKTQYLENGANKPVNCYQYYS